MTPKAQFKLFKAGEYINGGFVAINMLLILGSVSAGVRVPIDILGMTGAACVAWFLCSDGVEKVMQKYNLDKQGNPKRKDNG